MGILRRLLMAGFAVLALAAIIKAEKKGREPLRVVPSVDFSRYAGTWYEIARLPNRFQKSCAGEVSATYSVRDDGEIDVVNRCRGQGGGMKQAKGLARAADKDGPNTILEVRFAPAFLSSLPFVWGDYQIIELAPDYSHAVVGTPDRKYLWVLARAPRMDEATYNELVNRASRQGFDVSRLVRTRQAG